MQFDFEFFLTSAVLISGLIYLADILVFAKHRAASVKQPLLIEYARAFFPVLLLVLLLRSFVAEPFRIPSGSLKPTLLVGDFILVNKFKYGLRLPVLHTKILKIDEPAHADIALFHWREDYSKDLIKRVIGVPGDRISYINKVLYVNGEEMPQKVLGETSDNNGSAEASWPVQIREETLFGVKHKIYVNLDVPANDFSLTVTPGNYFMMGDNRDSSYDSRYWGFVAEKDLLGKAEMILLSWNSEKLRIRTSRLFQRINGLNKN